MMRILLLILIPLSGLCQNRLIPAHYSLSGSKALYSVIEDNGLTVYLECLEVNNDLMIFDIEVINQCGQTFEFDPEEIYYYQSDEPFSPVEDDNWEYHFSQKSQYNFRRFAKSSREVESYYKKKIQSNENTKTVLAILGTAFTIYDAVKDGQDYSREPTRDRINRSVARDVTLMASMTAIDVASTELTKDQIRKDEDLYYLPEEYLQSSVLLHGDSIRGKIYFSKKYSQTFYRIMVPVDDLLFSFEFRWPAYEEKKVIKTN